MNLRHIDPRSTDWMDAMLEGEVQGGRGGTHRHGTRENTDEVQADSNEAEFLAAPPDLAAETHANRPPPGR